MKIKMRDNSERSLRLYTECFHLIHGLNREKKQTESCSFNCTTRVDRFGYFVEMLQHPISDFAPDVTHPSALLGNVFRQPQFSEKPAKLEMSVISKLSLILCTKCFHLIC